MKVFLLLLLPACLAAQALRIRVVESSGPVHVAGGRTRTPLVVVILDENGAPAQGATVSFRLPASGPGGTFSNGLTTDVVIAGADGKAAASSVRWNKTPGAFEIRVAAGKGESRALMVSARRLLPSAVDSPAAASAGRSRRKLILIVAGVAAGSAVAGLSVVRRAAPAASGSQPPAPTLSVGTPVITIGGP